MTIAREFPKQFIILHHDQRQSRAIVVNTHECMSIKRKNTMHLQEFEEKNPPSMHDL